MKQHSLLAGAFWLTQKQNVVLLRYLGKKKSHHHQASMEPLALKSHTILVVSFFWVK